MWVRQAGAPLVGSPRPVQPRHAAPLHQRGWPHSAPRTPPSPPPPGERPLPPPAECCRTAPGRNRGSPPPSLGRDKTVVTQNPLAGATPGEGSLDKNGDADTRCRQWVHPSDSAYGEETTCPLHWVPPPPEDPEGTPRKRR